MSVFTDVPGQLLGPLTTTWTLPASCSAFYPACATCDYGWLAQTCRDYKGAQGVSDDAACWPPVTAGATFPGQGFIGLGYYSPGTVCPSGYATACTAKYGESPGWQVQYRLSQDETAIGCCPSGYSCANINGNTCVLAVTDSTTLSTAYCDGTVPVSTGTRAFPDVVTITKTEGVSVATRVPTIYAPMFQLNARPVDYVAKSTKTTDTHSSSPTGASPPENDNTSKGSSGLSTGAKAGIGVGVSIGALLVLGLIAALLLSRKKKAKAPLGSELHAETKYGPVTTGESYELSANHFTAELPGSRPEYG